MSAVVNFAKKATNITLSVDVLADAKRLGINISHACDGYLRELVRREEERLWKAEHAEFIANYNQVADTEGLPLEQWRGF